MSTERDLAAIAAEPRTVRIAGRDLKVKAYTPRLLGKLTAWLKEHATHPVAAVKPLLRDATPPERDSLLSAAFKEARESWPPAIGSSQANALFSEGDGLLAFIRIALEPGNPGLTAAEVDEIANNISMEEYGQLSVALAGKDPETADLDPNSPASSA